MMFIGVVVFFFLNGLSLPNSIDPQPPYSLVHTIHSNMNKTWWFAAYTLNRVLESHIHSSTEKKREKNTSPEIVIYGNTCDSKFRRQRSFFWMWISCFITQYIQCSHINFAKGIYLIIYENILHKLALASSYVDSLTLSSSLFSISRPLSLSVTTRFSLSFS